MTFWVYSRRECQKQLVDAGKFTNLPTFGTDLRLDTPTNVSTVIASKPVPYRPVFTGDVANHHRPILKPVSCLLATISGSEKQLNALLPLLLFYGFREVFLAPVNFLERL